MTDRSCPACKEEVHPNAILCKHCHTKILRTRRDKVLAAVEMVFTGVAIPAVTECGARCVRLDGAAKQECLDDCRAAEAVAAVASKLLGELYQDFADIVWGGGDIDPLPLERAVRERFGPGKVR